MLKRKIASGSKGAHPHTLKSESESAQAAAWAPPSGIKSRFGLNAVTGVVSLSPRGFGFLNAADGSSYYMAAPVAAQALPGDEVTAMVSAPNPRTGSSEVVAITRIRRSAGRLMCEVHRVADLLQLLPDEPCFKLLGLKASLPRAKEGDVVAVRVASYDGPPLREPVAVEIETNLGPRGKEGFLEAYTVWRYGFEQALPDFDAAEQASAEDAGRQDLRQLPFVTIDGESTLDMDDALHAAKEADGWLVHVAISDVASLVSEGSALDEAAALRCTSLYLPGCVVPMLPPQLSNGLCSLAEGVDRRAVVLRMRLDASGRLLESTVIRAWVRSAARLSYAQVSDWLDGSALSLSADREKEVLDSLRALVLVYRLLLDARFARGMLEFEDPEPQLQSNTPEEGGTLITWEGRTEAHKLVEEFMLLANNTAGSLLVQRFGAALLRQQVPPSPKEWKELQDWAQTSRGVSLPEQPCMKALAELSRHPEPGGKAHAFQKIIGAMRPASYVAHTEAAPSCGHFSLGYPYYTHFTSPIRRYADLLAHRLLLKPEGATLSVGELAFLAVMAARCSERSAAAKKAERYVWDQLKVQSLVAHAKQDVALKGRVLRENAQGIRVLLTDWQLVGWLPASLLKAAGWRKEKDAWVRDGSPSLEEGAPISDVYWWRVAYDRPAHPELHLGLSPLPEGPEKQTNR